MVEKDDFSQLKTLCTVLVVEIKLYFLRVSVNFRELDDKISFQAELQFSVGNFSPAKFKHVPNMDLYFRGRLARMVARALEANTFKHKFFVEFNFDPGPLVVLDVPFIPLFLARTQ